MHYQFTPHCVFVYLYCVHVAMLRTTLYILCCCYTYYVVIHIMLLLYILCCCYTYYVVVIHSMLLLYIVYCCFCWQCSTKYLTSFFNMN